MSWLEREIYETMTEIQLGSRLVGSAKSEARQPSRQHSRDWAIALSPTPVLVKRVPQICRVGLSKDKERNNRCKWCRKRGCRSREFARGLY